MQPSPPGLSPPPPPPDAPPGPAAARPLRLLVVDDDEVDRLIVRRRLREAAVLADVDEAAGTDEAARLLDGGGYDCLLLDYNIPGGDALGLLRTVRRTRPETPVVMLTGQGDEEVAVELMKAGAADYLPKASLTAQRLATSLRHAVELARAQAAARRAQEEVLRGAERSRFLAEASAVLATSLELDATLERVAQLSVPVLGDYSLVYLVDEQGGTAGVASAHHDPVRTAAARVIAERHRPPADHPTSVMAQVIRTGETRVLADISEAALARITDDPAVREATRVLAPRNALVVPLAARGAVIGSMTFSRGAARPPFAPDEVRLAEDLAARTASALDNARLYAQAEQARDRTERLQRVTALLATALPRDEVAHLFVTQVRETFDAHTAWVGILSDDGTTLETVAHAGLSPEGMRPFARIPADAPLPSTDVLRDGEGRWFSSKQALVAAYPALAERMLRFEQEAIAVEPLDVGGGVFGVVTLGFHEPREFRREDRELGLAMARQFAQAMERARLFEAERASRAVAEAARAEAEEANRAKSEFLARMSHDLRTPLNAIGGYAQLLEMGVHGPVTEAQREAIGRVQRAQQHLLALINDILSFARLEAGQVRIDEEDVPVRTTLMELGALVRPDAERRGIALEIDTGPADVVARADEERLMQVLTNLTSNALKFTPRGGRVHVQGESDAQWVRLRVRDTGIGIPPHRLEAIFNPFVQGRDSTEERREGVGLGLAISRELSRMMGGDLAVESVEGKGSTFTVLLARSPGPPD
jgi:signal transduction histidine kinase/DNA-binding response OmpR family regulator